LPPALNPDKRGEFRDGARAETTPTKTRAALGLAVTLLVGLLARASHAQTPADWDRVVAAAKAEGRVVLYSGSPGSPEHKDIGRLFEAKYGIKVDTLDGPGSEIMERIRVEVMTGKTAADVSHIGTTGQVVMARAGLLAQHGGVPNLARLAMAGTAEEEVPVFNNAYGLLINNRLVLESDEPKSWRDLADARWKNRILSSPMSAAGTGATWFGVMQDAFGLGFHEQLARQNLTFGQSGRENQRRVARGEFAMTLPFVLPNIGALQGLPVKALVPAEGVAYTPFTVAVLKGAPHPNAARLLINFFLEPEAQLVYARNGFAIATRGLEDQVPEKWRWAVNVKLLGRQNLDGQEERQRLAARIYEGK
jgi:iron(III) transport system substrate-binding protein